MPSFAKKPADSNATGVIEMGNVFVGGQSEKVLQMALTRAEDRAKAVLREDMPNHISKLQEILDSAKEEDSPCWNGLTKQGLFVPENVRLVGISESMDTGLPTPPQIGGEKSPLTDGSLSNALNSLVTTDLGIKSSPLRAKKTRLEGMEDGEEPLDGCFLGGLEVNAACIRLLRVVEQECDKAMDLCRDLKRWINLNVPTIEDGNNWGQEIQEYVLKQVDECFNNATRLRGLPRNHFSDRMGLARTWNRFPNLQDHPHAIASSDRWDFYLAISALEKLKDMELMLLHSFKQNWAKIYDPKNLKDGGATMIGGMY